MPRRRWLSDYIYRKVLFFRCGDLKLVWLGLALGLARFGAVLVHLEAERGEACSRLLKTQWNLQEKFSAKVIICPSNGGSHLFSEWSSPWWKT